LKYKENKVSRNDDVDYGFFDDNGTKSGSGQK
jgi:hypothetical protein